MVVYVEYVAVAGKGSRDLFESFNYGHTVVEFRQAGPYFVGLLRIESDNEKRVQYLTQYQVMRYRSGLHAAQQLKETPSSETLTDFLHKIYPAA
jgi:hypothetical protein